MRGRLPGSGGRPVGPQTLTKLYPTVQQRNMLRWSAYLLLRKDPDKDAAIVALIRSGCDPTAAGLVVEEVTRTMTSPMRVRRRKEGQP
jgi:hypothetical protein